MKSNGRHQNIRVLILSKLTTSEKRRTKTVQETYDIVGMIKQNTNFRYGVEKGNRDIAAEILMEQKGDWDETGEEMARMAGILRQRDDHKEQRQKNTT